jgi:hypothetical protein
MRTDLRVLVEIPDYWTPEQAFADGDRDAAVPQAVEQRVDEMLLLEQLVPVLELQRRGDDRRHAVVAPVDQPEEGIGLLGLHREIVDLVDHQRLQAAQALEQPCGRAVGERRIELVQQLLRIVKAAAIAVEAGLPQDAVYELLEELRERILLRYAAQIAAAAREACAAALPTGRSKDSSGSD